MNTLFYFMRGMFPLFTPFKKLNYDQIKNKKVLITGSNSGLGYETTKQLLLLGGQVFIPARSIQKSIKTKNKLLKINPNYIIHIGQMDLSSLQSIRDYINTLKDITSVIDILILNAGIMMAPYSLSNDGVETHYAVNYLSNVFLIQECSSLLDSSIEPRIVMVNSNAHFLGVIPKDLNLASLNSKNSYNSLYNYANSKLALMLLMKKMVRLKPQYYINSVNPGGVNTNLFNFVYTTINNYLPYISSFLNYLLSEIAHMLLFTPQQACSTMIYLATSQDIIKNKIRGEYYVNYGVINEAAEIVNVVMLQDKCFDFTINLLQCKTDYT